eukprot:2532886-Pyramimonas_sp.AAC.2
MRARDICPAHVQLESLNLRMKGTAEKGEPRMWNHYIKGLRGVECTLAVIGTGGPVLRVLCGEGVLFGVPVRAVPQQGGVRRPGLRCPPPDRGPQPRGVPVQDPQDPGAQRRGESI